MLLKFSVQNFRSIGKKQEINFIASNDSTFNNQLIDLPLIKDKILPVMSIYGSNAAGKTNLLMAIRTAISMIKGSLQYQDGDKLPYQPFKLNDKYGNTSTKYEFVFIQNEKKYYYGFAHNASRIKEEYLYHYPNGKQSIIFERSNKKYKFVKDQSELETLANRTLINRLFFATAAEWNFQQIQIPFRYIKQNYVFYANQEIGNPTWKDYTYKKISSDVKFKNRILSILKQINSDIKDINIRFEKKKLMDGDPLSLFLFNKKITNQIGEVARITTSHFGKDEKSNIKDVTFSLNEESKGIQKFLEFIGPWLDILDKGKFLFIDELETSLHPFIVKHLIKLFLDPIINKKGGQLIYTTHDTSLLDLSIFRRDQIWFVEKDRDRSSDYYSLADLKSVRKDENIQKGYLRGKFGSIPFTSIDLGDF